MLNMELIVIQPRQAHTHTVICLHGRYCDAQGFCWNLLEEPVSEHVQVAPGQQRILPHLFPTIRWVFPAASSITSSALAFGRQFPPGFMSHLGQLSPWFDPEKGVEVQVESLRRSMSMLRELIEEEEQRGVPRERIFLAGTCQGFATIITTFLTGHQGYAGLIGLSTSSLPFSDQSAAITFRNLSNQFAPRLASPNGLMLTETQQRTPVFLSHSFHNKIVRWEHGWNVCQQLREIMGNESVAWQMYEHQKHRFRYGPEEMDEPIVNGYNNVYNFVHGPRGIDDIYRFLTAHMGQ